MIEDFNNTNWINKYSDAVNVVKDTSGKRNCPNCGAPITSEKCPYCGAVFMDFGSIDADKPFFLKIKHNGEFYICRVILRSTEVSVNTSNLYNIENSLLREMIVSCPSETTITLEFDAC